MKNSKAVGEMTEAIILARLIRLRIEPTKGGPLSGIRWAKDFVI